MPNADGRFIGTGWSRALEDAWTRIFGPALADDPAYEEPDVFDLRPIIGHCSKCGEAREDDYTCRDGGSTVPSEQSPEVPHAPDDYGWPSTYGGEPR